MKLLGSGQGPAAPIVLEIVRADAPIGVDHFYELLQVLQRHAVHHAATTRVHLTLHEPCQLYLLGNTSTLSFCCTPCHSRRGGEHVSDSNASLLTSYPPPAAQHKFYDNSAFFRVVPPNSSGTAQPHF